MALGRGLSSLINQKNIEELQKNHPKDAVLKVPLNKLKPNPYQPRKNFDENALNDLANSIKVHGILQPIVAIKTNENEYTIIAGERRWRASKIAGLKEVPVILLTGKKDKEYLELAILENLQREDLSPLERALSYKRLQDEFGLTQAEIGERVGKSRVAVSNTIRLLELDDEVKNALEKGEISENHARALLALKDKKDQKKLLDEIKLKKLSARNTEVVVRSYLKRPNKNLKELSSEMKNAAVRLEEKLGTKVLIKPGKHVSDGGEIVIKYFSNEDLKRILNTLL